MTVRAWYFLNFVFCPISHILFNFLFAILNELTILMISCFNDSRMDCNVLNKDGGLNVGQLQDLFLNGVLHYLSLYILLVTW